MQVRIFMAVGLLALVTGCGGEPNAPPKGADKAPPALDMNIGTVDGEGEKKDDKKDAPPPPGNPTPDASPAEPK